MRIIQESQKVPFKWYFTNICENLNKREPINALLTNHSTFKTVRHMIFLPPSAETGQM